MMARGTRQAHTAALWLAIALLGCSPAAEAGRRKKAPPTPKEVPELPDPGPGSVRERGFAHDVEGALMDRLGFALRMYAYAMRRYITDAAALAAAPHPVTSVSEASVEVFARQLRVATFAYFEYTWIDGDTVHRRAYVSRSNRGLDRFILRTTVDLAVPATNEATYMRDSDMIHFVRETSPAPGSNVAAVQGGPVNRDNDAEITILQLLSREIQENPAMRHGTLVAYVSQQPCESCSPALRLFARETAATVSVNYIYGSRGAGHETPLYLAFRQAREVAAMLLLAFFAQPGAAASSS